ncbi:MULTISPECIES: hypothetical protein [unclassified Streptomyces]|nr:MULTISPECIES: hypothetical protein [unclassified Streptomyces]MDF3142486.1 hypothetical protein [Streptomyces sp. T21Q-yed]WDF43909.1 hypothetical protein PBV52_47565 [Streptomyces sp. T12]
MTGIPVALQPAIADSFLAEIMLLLTVLARAECHRRPTRPGRR